jgi:uroporphyrinogen-III synthase
MTSARGTLEGLRILVTRPAHQADQLCRLIEARGATAVRLPLLSIMPVPHASAIAHRMEDACTFDGWIFTSSNAVHYAREIWKREWPVALTAIGPATAAALEASGRVSAAPAAAYNSEALLELPQFQNVEGKKFLIVTGEDGLSVLTPALRARGAEVELAEVYRRVPLPYDEARVVAALRATAVVIITSGGALEHLLNLTPEPSRAGLLKKQLIVPSLRMIEKAAAMGFRAAQAPARMSDAAIIELIERTALPSHD